MRIIPSCEKCLYDRQINIAGVISDEEARDKYLAEIRELLTNRKEDDSAPYMVYRFGQILKKYCDKVDVYPDIKQQYNSLMLEMEAEIEAKIEASPDPLETAIIYARIGNYIDFGAMDHVEQSELLRLLEEESRVRLDKATYELFGEACAKGKNFLLLSDNCGEIVLDKLFVRQLKKRFPHLTVHAMVRGQAVLNDATLEDAVFSGMNKEAILVSNGNGVAGTVVELLSPQARSVLEEADVILSKGQGNYESLSGYKGTVYYSFLCKCELFTGRFGVPRLTGMFVREEN
ncbi:MAG: DUF89 family protein [Lachnospiraceae bacterium]|nr:DUF89 family protein [Lachnospiraceae bacterium]